MKTLAALAFVVAAFAPVLAAQSTASFTGKWEGTLTLIGPDGSPGNAMPAEFNLTQKGKVLEGTAGPASQQWKIDKGEVNGDTATFELQQPNGGPLMKFTLTIVKERLQGGVIGERDGEVRKGQIDAARAKGEA